MVRWRLLQPFLPYHPLIHGKSKLSCGLRYIGPKATPKGFQGHARVWCRLAEISLLLPLGSGEKAKDGNPASRIGSSFP